MTSCSQQRPVVLIGAGGHAKVIADIARLTHRTIAGVLVLNNDNALPLKTLGDDTLLLDRAFLNAHDFIIAMGQTLARRRIATTLETQGATLATMIHPSAVIADEVEIGAGTALIAGAIVNPGTQIGQHCTLNTACGVDHDCRLHSGVQIGPGARLCGGVTCRQDAYVGAGAVVVEGQTIGAGAIIGASATVLSPVPPGTTVVGTPAREI